MMKEISIFPCEYVNHGFFIFNIIISILIKLNWIKLIKLIDNKFKKFFKFQQINLAS